MYGFIDSLKPFWEKYRIEVLLVSAAFFIALVSIFIFFANLSSEKEETPIVSPIKTIPAPENKIVVDLSGSVERPDVYEISSGARLKDILILAGGLSTDADRNFFARNFNLARIIKDQEKIYVPSSEEIVAESGGKNDQTLQSLESNTLGISTKISINSASVEQLDTLPGIGEVTAGKIIQNRPYQSIDDLLNNKIVGKSVFEKIKDLIQI